MKCLVTAADPTVGHVDYPFPGVRNAVCQFKHNPVDFDGEIGDYIRASSRLDAVFCEESDVEAVINRMTQSYPGVDVYVYKVDSISVRAPGDLKTKAITKDGVLPS
jgi:hypothetical protein